MATLTSALNLAFSGLATSAAQTALVSRNVSNANDPDYTRKTANIITLPGGSSSVASYNRSADKRLLDKLLDVTSSAAGRQAMLDALNRLAETVGDPQSDGSPTALIGKLQESLKAYESNPADAALGSSVVTAAKNLATALNQASAAVQQVRATADQDMAASVSRINALLDQFKVANDAVVRGAGTPSELTDNLDQRDRILKALADETGIRTVTRPNNDIAIFTDSGVTLFETSPRRVTFVSTPNYAAGVNGNAVYADGVRITGLPSAMPAASGNLQGLADIRGRISTTYQSQLDEVARGLISMFAESDQSSSGPDLAGLFSYAGGPVLPPAGAIATGLAGTIKVNPLADPAQGGTVSLLRDGGFNGAAYVYNGTGAAGFQTRLQFLVTGFDAAQDFDPAAQIGATATLSDYSASASSWLSGLRQEADDKAKAGQALKSRASDALLRVTGVNIDEEMATMLDLEKSYHC